MSTVLVADTAILGGLITGVLLALQGFVETGLSYCAAGWSFYSARTSTQLGRQANLAQALLPVVVGRTVWSEQHIRSWMQKHWHGIP